MGALLPAPLVSVVGVLMGEISAGSPAAALSEEQEDMIACTATLSPLDGCCSCIVPCVIQDRSRFETASAGYHRVEWHRLVLCLLTDAATIHSGLFQHGFLKRSKSQAAAKCFVGWGHSFFSQPRLYMIINTICSSFAGLPVICRTDLPRRRNTKVPSTQQAAQLEHLVQ